MHESKDSLSAEPKKAVSGMDRAELQVEVFKLRAQLDALMGPDFTLTPIEPTEEMVHAAEDIPAPRPFGKVYRAMLAAAPKADSLVASRCRAEGGGTSENSRDQNSGKTPETRMVAAFDGGPSGAAGTDKDAERFGCHCDLEPHMEPDGCVIDTDRREDCVSASRHATKEECQYWQPIQFAARGAHTKAGEQT